MIAEIWLKRRKTWCNGWSAGGRNIRKLCEWVEENIGETL